jgi:hypothetical protein
MTLKQQLIEEIEEIPEPLISQLLDYVLFLKQRYIEENITKEEEINILQSLKDYEAGDYLTLEEYEASQQ